MGNSVQLFIIQMVLSRCALGLLGLSAFIVFLKTRSLISGLFSAAVLLFIAGYLTHQFAIPSISFEEMRNGVEFSFIEPWESISRLLFAVAAIVTSVASVLVILAAFRRNNVAPTVPE